MTVLVGAPGEDVPPAAPYEQTQRVIENMSTPQAYMHESTMSLPLLAGLGAVIGGSELAISTLIAGSVSLFSLFVLGRLSQRVLLRRAGHNDLVALVLKQLLMVPAAIGLMIWLGALPVLLGWSSVVLGAVVHALVTLLHAADVAHLSLSTTLGEN